MWLWRLRGSAPAAAVTMCVWLRQAGPAASPRTCGASGSWRPRASGRCTWRLCVSAAHVRASESRAWPVGGTNRGRARFEQQGRLFEPLCARFEVRHGEVRAGGRVCASGASVGGVNGRGNFWRGCAAGIRRPDRGPRRLPHATSTLAIRDFGGTWSDPRFYSWP
jgi:hypothetical protein